MRAAPYEGESFSTSRKGWGANIVKLVEKGGDYLINFKGGFGVFVCVSGSEMFNASRH